jgi:hypothetical protein
MKEKTDKEIIEDIVRRLRENIKKTVIEKDVNNIAYHRDYYKYLGMDGR